MRSVRSLRYFGNDSSFIVFPGSRIIFRLYILTISDQTEVTPRMSESD